MAKILTGLRAVKTEEEALKFLEVSKTDIFVKCYGGRRVAIQGYRNTLSIDTIMKHFNKIGVCVKGSELANRVLDLDSQGELKLANAGRFARFATCWRRFFGHCSCKKTKILDHLRFDVTKLQAKLNRIDPTEKSTSLSEMIPDAESTRSSQTGSAAYTGEITASLFEINEDNEQPQTFIKQLHDFFIKKDYHPDSIETVFQLIPLQLFGDDKKDSIVVRELREALIKHISQNGYSKEDTTKYQNNLFTYKHVPFKGGLSNEMASHINYLCGRILYNSQYLYRKKAAMVYFIKAFEQGYSDARFIERIYNDKTSQTQTVHQYINLSLSYILGLKADTVDNAIAFYHSIWKLSCSGMYETLRKFAKAALDKLEELTLLTDIPEDDKAIVHAVLAEIYSDPSDFIVDVSKNLTFNHYHAYPHYQYLADQGIVEDIYNFALINDEGNKFPFIGRRDIANKYIGPKDVDTNLRSFEYYSKLISIADLTLESSEERICLESMQRNAMSNVERLVSKCLVSFESYLTLFPDPEKFPDISSKEWAHVLRLTTKSKIQELVVTLNEELEYPKAEAILKLLETTSEEKD